MLSSHPSKAGKSYRQKGFPPKDLPSPPTVRGADSHVGGAEGATQLGMAEASPLLSSLDPRTRGYSNPQVCLVPHPTLPRPPESSDAPVCAATPPARRSPDTTYTATHGSTPTWEEGARTWGGASPGSNPALLFPSVQAWAMHNLSEKQLTHVCKGRALVITLLLKGAEMTQIISDTHSNAAADI